MSPLDETAQHLEVILGWGPLDALLLAIAIHATRSISEDKRTRAAAIVHETLLTKW